MNTKKIAAALRALADAVEETDVHVGSKGAEPVDLPPQTGADEANEPEEEAAEPETVEEVTLADLQELGASLIRAGKREEFKKVLEKRKLKNLSAADETDYPAIWAELSKVEG